MLEVVRIVREYLADATVGINATLATIPIDTGDTVPADIVTFVDEYSDLDTALKRTNGTRPLLNVRTTDITAIDPEIRGHYRDYNVTVLVEVVLTDTDTHEARQAVNYYRRAIFKSLHTLELDETTKTRNSIVMMYLTTLSAAFTQTHIEDDTVSGVVEMTWRIRDIQTY